MRINVQRSDYGLHVCWRWLRYSELTYRANSNQPTQKLVDWL